jgi:hypothetical protein
LPALEPRLQKRYQQLVKDHMSNAQSVAAGLRNLPQTSSAMSAVQAAWRFYHNERVNLVTLAAPLLAHAQQAAITECQDYCLVMHDWSPIHYTDHESKTDRIVLCNKHDFGYLLQAALLVSDKAGAPMAPLYLGVEASDGVHSTRRETLLPRRAEIDEVNRTMGYLEQLALPKPIVNIIDRQGDSITHLRRFMRCGRLFLIRGNDVRRVLHQGESKLLSEVEASIPLNYSRDVQYHGKPAQQYVGETTVTLTEPGHKQRRKFGKITARKIAGRAITLRLIIAQVRNEQGQCLATWRLWTNLADTVSADTIALWYYWRWRIESFFKLIKRAGQCLEQWQQESAEAVAKRLLVAAQACVIVWALQESGPEAAPLRKFLVRLSARVMKRGVESTAPALLAGMWQLLAIIDTLENHSLDEIQSMARQLFSMLGLENNFKGFR